MKTHNPTDLQQGAAQQKSRPVVWSIAASDSGGGAGMQADLNTIHSLGCHGCTVITAITAQNSLAVEKIHPLSAVDLAAQWQALEKDLQPRAIKIGLLPEPKTLRWLARRLQDVRRQRSANSGTEAHNGVFCVWDPVLKASTGARLLGGFSQEEINPLLKQVDLITPNLQETETLTKISIQSYDDIEKAATQLLERGVGSVLIKGGHSFSDDPYYCRDYFLSQQGAFWLSHTKQKQIHSHGTGCTLASAIASFFAQGHSLSDSVVLANRFIQQSLRLAAPQGQGAGPVWQTPLENNPLDFSELLLSVEHFDTHVGISTKTSFAKAAPLGLYAITNNLTDLQRLIAQGVDTLQWRVKLMANGDADSEQERNDHAANLQQAIACCKQANIPLYINDDWQLALEHNAYGIHLGQEDLNGMSQSDLKRIQKHGIRLGISCHNETELAYAHGLKPSYLAFGPVFTPNSKAVNHNPLGLNTLREWQKGYGQMYPTTCIGGIELGNLKDVLTTGIHSVAVISALNDPQESKRFITTFTQTRPAKNPVS